MQIRWVSGGFLGCLEFHESWTSGIPEFHESWNAGIPGNPAKPTGFLGPGLPLGWAAGPISRRPPQGDAWGQKPPWVSQGFLEFRNSMIHGIREAPHR